MARILSVMSACYSNRKMADMHVMYDLANGNTLAASWKILQYEDVKRVREIDGGHVEHSFYKHIKVII